MEQRNLGIKLRTGKYVIKNPRYMSNLYDNNFIDLINEIKEKVFFYNYSLYVYGSILYYEGKTRDVDLILCGGEENDHKKIYDIMEKINKIGFKMDVAVDICYMKVPLQMVLDRKNKKIYNLYDNAPFDDIIKENGHWDSTKKYTAFRPYSDKGDIKEKLSVVEFPLGYAPFLDSKNVKMKDFRSKKPIKLIENGYFLEEIFDNINHKRKMYWEENLEYYRIGDTQTNKIFLLEGIQDFLVQDFFKKISKLNYKNYSLIVVGGILQNKLTKDIDLVLHGGNSEDFNHIHYLLKNITEIGLKMNILCDILYLPNGAEKWFDKNKIQNSNESFISYYFTNKMEKKTFFGGVTNFEKLFKQEKNLYYKMYTFPHKKTKKYLLMKELADCLPLCSNGIFSIPNEEIFIQIACYRDPEIVKTIEDCIKKSKYPDRLKFGICWQNCKEDSSEINQKMEEYKKNKNFVIIDVPWYESEGLGWARNKIQQCWRGEKYTLQIDSHHRFETNWDSKLIKIIKKLQNYGYKKPIISTYAESYDSKTGKIKTQGIQKIISTGFTERGTLSLKPQKMDKNFEVYLQEPIKARFMSGHFYFTLGTHCREYEYDPNLYFLGDEITLSVRSFTLGYDLFHPNKCLLWHEYDRENKPKHYTDFNDINNSNMIKETGIEKHNKSIKKIRKLLKIDDYNNDEEYLDSKKYGLGNERSLEDYEKYAGICFKKQIIHNDVIIGADPPTFLGDKLDFTNKSEEKEYNMNFSIPKDFVQLDRNLDFIYFAVHDSLDKVLTKIYMRRDEFPQIFTTQESSFNHKFKSKSKPFKYVLWNYGEGMNSNKKTWLNRVDIRMDF